MNEQQASYDGPMLTPQKVGSEMRTITATANQLWRQVGWLGFSGRVYSMDDAPQLTEKGGFSILWLLVDNDPIDVGDPVG